jgi:hypothetical protein
VTQKDVSLTPDRMLYPFHSSHTLCIQETSSHSNCIGTETQSFHDVCTSRDSSVDVDLKRSALFSLGIRRGKPSWIIFYDPSIVGRQASPRLC